MKQAKKKLIEVALPLDAINDASAYDKMPGIGPHPKGVHKWWAPLPLPCARAVLFASVIDDPDDEEQRESLLAILRTLVSKTALDDDRFFQRIRKMIDESCDGNLPTLVDPFAGSGAIPLEGQRLGLNAAASDLNPVAVLMNKALLEIPSRFRGRAAVNPEAQAKLGATSGWVGPSGLVQDIRYYGNWIRNEAINLIGNLYPRVSLPKEHGGGEADVIAWIWSRTVKCPNPACGAQMPLVRSFWLAQKQGRKAWIEPQVNPAEKTFDFVVRTDDGTPPSGTKQQKKSACLICGTNNISDAQLREQSLMHGIGSRLMAVVAHGPRGRIYLSPPASLSETASANADWLDQPLPKNARWFSPPLYGLTTYKDLFTDRQLVALGTLGDLVLEARDHVLKDAVAAGYDDDGQSLHSGGSGASAYSDAVATYLAMVLDRCADFNNSLCRWKPSGEQTIQLFARQAIPMVWDYTEPNILGTRAVCWYTAVDILADALSAGWTHSTSVGIAEQLDATAALERTPTSLISTDPPYYDNIGYSDLSDFFYVWLRHTIKDIYPDLFSTILTPKAEELIATPYRFNGDKQAAKDHFEKGLSAVFANARKVMDPRFPMTVYYAFKQSESESEEPERVATVGRITLTTGWETLLEALMRAGFQITATWPIRASGNWRITSMGTNALATYIVLACRPRDPGAPLATRREFQTELRQELPGALRPLQQSCIAPVDLAQAAIGPGMAVFSRYSRVIEAGSSAMSVRTALGIINQVLDEVLAEHESDYDFATRWAVAWFDEFGFKEGPFGRAEQLSKAKNTAVDGMERDGIILSDAGKVRLLTPSELDSNWDPSTDPRLTLWEVTHHLVHALDVDGETGAAEILRKLGSSFGEQAKDLAYRLYVVCDKKKWNEEALGYNALVVAWPEISRLAGAQPESTAQRLDI